MDNINDKLNTLSESERKIALEILKQYGEQGKSDLYDTLKYADYDEIPVDINTFLHDKKYLGNALYDQEGKFTLFPYWEEKLKEIFPTNITTKYNTIVFTGAIGLGKAQPLYSKLLTEDGFKAMGDITLSDKIYGKDGKLHSIIGIFPQGKKKTYRITFKDGTHTDCADNHLWTIYDKRYNYREETLTTEDIIKNKPIFKMNKQGFKERLLSIPLCEPVQFDKKDLFIDPYVLGVLLGDGGLSCGSVNITSSDIEIFNYVETAINEKGYTLSEQISLSRRIIKKDKNLHNNQYNHNPNKYFQEIKKLKLDTTSSEKFIPDIYKYSSVEDRTALLQGLMDTDGTINKTGSIIQFNTISKKLAEDFAFIVRSLGGIITSIRWISAKYKNKQGETISCKPSCIVSFKLPKNICPFRLSRKAARINPRATAPRKLIENIQYIGEEDCQCICTDASDHLYITDDFLVTHNSTIAVICLLYMLYRLLCLKDPYLYYGLQPIDKITISLMNITLENAKGVALDKMNQMILSSEWFMSHGKMTGTSNLEFVPEKHIELITASSNNQVIGRAVFCNFTDEVNFGLTSDVEKLKKKQKQLISQIDSRMRSRFLRGTYLPTLNIIASSKNSEQSFLEDYIQTKKKNESTTTLIVDEPQWVVDSRKRTKETFFVAIGNKFLANELLPINAPKELIEEYKAKGYSLIEVPMGYRENFEDNIDGALTDIAGIATAASLKYISGVRWNEIKTARYENPFTREIIEVGTAKDDHAQYYDFFDLSKVPDELKMKPLYIHLDMSKKGDKTGIAGVYVLGKKPKVEGEDSSREMFYRVAFNVSVKAPKGYEISFDKNRIFIRWLREHGFNIKGVSSDTFQSAQIQQQLISDGFDVKVISVDRLDSQTKQCLPYAYLKSCIYDRRLEVYKDCDFLTDEVLGLERESDGHINHPEQGTQGSKDAIDAVTGALFNASQNSEEFGYNYGEDYSAMFLGNNVTNNVNTSPSQNQMVVDFEEQLRQYNQIRQSENQQNDYNQVYISNDTLIW